MNQLILNKQKRYYIFYYIYNSIALEFYIDAYYKGGMIKLKLAPTELQNNMNNKTSGGLGSLALLAATSLIPAVAPAVGNLANNLFGKLFGEETLQLQ